MQTERVSLGVFLSSTMDQDVYLGDMGFLNQRILGFTKEFQRIPSSFHHLSMISCLGFGLRTLTLGQLIEVEAGGQGKTPRQGTA